MSDPLSSATRTTKRQVLVLSVIAITFKAFQVSIEKIPIAGLTINFDRGVFEFLITIALAYLLFTFALYYYIDIRNFQETHHQESTKKWREEKISELIFKWYAETDRLVRESSIHPYTASLTSLYSEILKDLAYPNRRANALLELKRTGSVPPHAGPPLIDDPLMILGPGGSGEADLRKQIYAKAKSIVESRTEKFVPALQRYRLRLWPRIFAVTAAYFIRNYVTDGLLPAVLAVLALAAMYDLIDVQFLTWVVPHNAG